MTPDAAAYLRRRLSHPPAGLVPALITCQGYEERDPRGQVVCRFDGEFFDIGYYAPGDRPTATTIVVFGVQVSVIPETLAVLREGIATRDVVSRRRWLRRSKRRFLVRA